jgi:DNA-binding response OmpR family regulator
MPDFNAGILPPHILIVEDDKEISTLIARYLNNQDMRTSIANHGGEMDLKLGHDPVDLIVLDLNLPKEDGLSICLRLRNMSNIPIVMLTAKGEEIDRIIGLEMGTDDYLPKPFNPRELLARIRAVLRRQTYERDKKNQTCVQFRWMANQPGASAGSQSARRQSHADRGGVRAFGSLLRTSGPRSVSRPAAGNDPRPNVGVCRAQRRYSSQPPASKN